MPSLNPQRRKTADPLGTLTGHRCARCREDLVLVRTHVSPARLGAPMTTEYYQCRACDSGFARSSETGTWKPWTPPEDI